MTADYTGFQRVRICVDVFTAHNGCVKNGAEGYIVSYFHGYDIIFEPTDAVNEGLLIESGTADGQFMVLKIPGYMFYRIN